MSFKPIIPIYIIVALLVLCIVAIILCIVKVQYRQTRLFRRIAIVIFLLFTMARPVFYVQTTVETALNNLDIYFVVDMTGSMIAKDCENGQARRYEKAIDDIIAIAKRFPGSSYSVLAEDYSFYTALPLTDNYDALDVAAHSLIPKNSKTTSDSDINGLLNYANTHVRRNLTRRRGHQPVLFYFGDGEDRVNSEIFVPNELKNSIVTGAVFAYGTEDGTEIESISSTGTISSSPIKDNNGKIVISSMNEGNIEMIATGLGVKYYIHNNGGLNTEALSNINAEATDYKMNDESAYEDIYWIFAIVLLGLLLWEFAYVLDKILLERKAIK